MTITRRQFLKRTGLATAGTVLGPGLFSNLLVRRAFAETIGDRYLVVLYLDGGNDGQNTIIPAATMPSEDPAGLRAGYDLFRSTSGSGGINIAPEDLADVSTAMLDPMTTTPLGFHPGLQSLADMYDDGKVAVIQGCGYPDYSLSHEESTAIWHTANPQGIVSIASSGWLGRHLAAEYGAAEIPGVTIDSSVAGEMQQTGTSVLAIRRLNDFGFPYVDIFNGTEEMAFRDAFDTLYTAAGAGLQPTLGVVGAAGSATLISSEKYPPLHDFYTSNRSSWNDAYGGLGTSTARDLREVAKLIYGVDQGQLVSPPGIEPRFFQVSNGGYDTHGDQGGADPNGAHFFLLSEVANAVELFFDDIADMGLGSKVLMVVWSEFARRIPQNSNGTDHGSQGPMFVIGESVNAGVYGNHPNIENELALDNNGNTPYSQDGSDDFRSTDFRDVYGTILKRWANMAHGDVQSVLPADTGDPNEYWTSQNFDMGFLVP